MKGINTSRWLLGGVVAGIVMYVIEGIINSAILGAEWKAWGAQASTVFPMPSLSTSMTYWFIQSMILGIVGVWIYAAIRPRMGAGPKTAICAGMTLWAAAWLGTFLNELAMAVVPCSIACGNLVGGIFAAVIPVTIGAWLYKE